MKELVLVFVSFMFFSCQKEIVAERQPLEDNFYTFSISSTNSKVSYQKKDKYPIYHTNAGQKGELVIHAPERALSAISSERAGKIYFFFTNFDWSMSIGAFKQLNTNQLYYEVSYSDDLFMKSYILRSEQPITIDEFKSSLLESPKLVGNLSDLTYVSNSRCAGLCITGLMAVVAVSVGVVNHCTNVINQGIANCNGENQCFTTGLCSVDCHSCN